MYILPQRYRFRQVALFLIILYYKLKQKERLKVVLFVCLFLLF